MNRTEIRWKKQIPGEVQFHPNGPQHSIKNRRNPGKKTTRKKVQFNCRMSNGKDQTFENRKYNAPRKLQSDKTNLDQHDSNSSINSFPNE